MEPSTASYLYGVIDRPEIPAIFDDLQMPSPVRCLPLGTFGALVRDVNLEEFGENALKERMQDPKWLEQHIWQHARILKAAMRLGTVIPMRFLTVFANDERLANSLLAMEATLRELFAKLEDKQEWGVKAFCDVQNIRATVEEQFDKAKQLKTQSSEKSSGVAYLVRKQLEELVRRESSLRLTVHLESICDRILSTAAEAKFNSPARDKELSDRRMVLNASLLVNQSSISVLINEVDLLREEYLLRGFEFELFGPLPPYSFSELPAFAARREATRPGGVAHV